MAADDIFEIDGHIDLSPEAAYLRTGILRALSESAKLPNARHQPPGFDEGLRLAFAPLEGLRAAAAAAGVPAYCPK